MSKSSIVNLIAVPDYSGDDNYRSIRDGILQSEIDRHDSEKDAEALQEIADRREADTHDENLP